MIPAPLSILTGGRTSSTLRPQWVRKPAAWARSRDRIDRRSSGLLVGRPAPVEGDDRPLVLEPDAALAGLGGVGLTAELVDPPDPVLDARVEHRLGPAGSQQLGAVRAEIGDRPDADHRARLRGAAAAHARHQPVRVGDRDQELARGLGHMRVGRVLDDRRQRAVDVEQDRGPFGVGSKRRERL